MGDNTSAAAPPAAPSTSNDANASKDSSRNGAPSVARTEYIDITDRVPIDKVELLAVPHLTALVAGSALKDDINVRHAASRALSTSVGYANIMTTEDVVLSDIVRRGDKSKVCRAYVRAGPREHCFFNGDGVVAGIVTCGGLCPGLNNVIRTLTLSLLELYGASRVLGFVGGYEGIHTRPPMELTASTVAMIHTQGGTILSSSRGGFDMDKILAALDKYGVNQLYCIGGDGTMRGASILAMEAAKRAHETGRVMAVAGIPKTIDNDIDHLDRSFGFNTAVAEAVKAIRSAKTEASCAVNGVGVVKLMGRSAGFIAAHAALSSGDCDLCLVPEVPIVLEGKNSCLDHLVRVVQDRGYAVVVVAEGAGEELLGKSEEVDASGNKKLPAIGYWMKKAIEAHFDKLPPGKDGATSKATVKYIDPSYMIRSVPADAADSLFCLLLAQNAVHGAMAGYTAFVTGLCNDRLVYIPMSAIAETSPRHLNPFGRTWERVLSSTGQPNEGSSTLGPCMTVASKTIK
jgi:6-phosphofructokinase 1